MSDPHLNKEFPKTILYGAGTLMLASLALAFFARATDMGTFHVPEAGALQTLRVYFEDLGPEGLDVIDANTNRTFTRVAPGEDGFIRGVVRSLSRIRRLEGLGQETPFELVRWADDRLSLSDPATGQQVQLVGFGQDNLTAFARLLAQAPDATAQKGAP